MTDWHQRWAEGRIGFHQADTHPVLTSFVNRLERGRILVPLCGKSVDLWFLVDRGFAPIGVELVDKAIQEFFGERGVDAATNGRKHTGGGVEMVNGDFFDVQPEPVDAIWDRAALIALPEEQRAAYAAQLMRWLRPGGTLLLCALEILPDELGGPPFSVGDTEIRSHFESYGRLDVLEKNEDVSLPPRAPDGMRASETTYLLTRA